MKDQRTIQNLIQSEADLRAQLAEAVARLEATAYHLNEVLDRLTVNTSSFGLARLTVKEARAFLARFGKAGS